VFVNNPVKERIEFRRSNRCTGYAMTGSIPIEIEV
jgi:hypothetical protein